MHDDCKQGAHSDVPVPVYVDEHLPQPFGGSPLSHCMAVLFAQCAA